jgi:ribulose 1,5-bisphosphate carboxylase large subunit-like protein
VSLIASLATTAIAGGSALVGYWQARQFTQNKLRYVDGVHKAIAPVLAGAAAVALATPVVWLLPLVGAGTALLFGGGVAMGVSAGARDIRKRLAGGA